MDRLIKINTYVYDFQIELIYWNNYYSSLIDFLEYSKNLSKEKKQRLHKEMADVKLNIIQLQKKLERRLKRTHYWESEKYYNEKFKNK